MAEPKKETLTLPKKAPLPEERTADERAEYLALQGSIDKLKPRDGSQVPPPKDRRA